MPGKSGRSSDDAKFAALKLGFSGQRNPISPAANGPRGTPPKRGIQEGIPVLTREKIRQSVGGAGPSSRGQDSTRQRMRNFDERVMAPRIAGIRKKEDAVAKGGYQWDRRTLR